MKHVFRLFLIIIMGTGAATSQPVWPERPVKFVVPFPAGGPADSSMRIVAKRLGDIWGQPTLVENRPGAPGMVFAASSAPDGHTLVLGAGSNMVTGPLMNNKLAYKPARDFVPISLILTNKPILTAHPATGIKSIRELIIYAKAKPGVLNYSSAGIGSPGHLMMEMFNDITSTQMTHIPYKGGAPAVAELLGGQVQLGINATPTVLQHVNIGKLVPLAIASAKRDRLLPSVPTMAESGISNLEFVIWYGLFAPSKTPKNIVEKISADIQKAIMEPSIADTIRSQGSDPEANSPQKFAKLIEDDIKVWSKLIRDKKLTLDE